MKKSLCGIVLCLSIVATLTACDKKDELTEKVFGVNMAELRRADTENITDNANANTNTTIKLFNGKAEVEAQIRQLAEKYKAETGVTVEVESAQSGVDVQATLKAYYLSDKMPDIFVCESSSFANWGGLLADMSDQDWTKDTKSALTDPTYGVIGFPYATEAIGLVYNADILKRAGIDASTLTSPELVRKAFEKLEQQKGSLGLTAVVGYCAEDQNLSWSTGNHIFGNYIDAGLDRADTTYIDMINNEHAVDHDRMLKFAAFVGLLQQYSDPDLVLTGTYEDQVKNFASGRYAFVTQGSWIGAVLTGDDAAEYASAGNFEIGMMPYVFDEGIDTILANPPSWWAVMKEGNVEASKAFLEWCAEDSGQKILVEEAGFVSPFTSCRYVASDPFAKVLSDYIAAGKTSNWHWMDMKEGIAANALGREFNRYAAGQMDADGFTTAIGVAIKDYYERGKEG
ncbi:ABC transporter substrate-binding protein [Oribacterium sp. WCC10]|uniref:ABC transporter substrate-binding protein n=1 Tax=Oribacterium sp. WCC10 TaxID=1855343 RepID=UPI0008E68AE8|nr:extracellular solute-binding protein [Oribacterium sp. WCC10]SFG34511.1 carbohydrate ABC transporter substrate-binding protein, CUT1 family [Oribacterium sp. WCC10]